MTVVRLDRPLVVGSGVAGCSVALSLGRAAIMTKGTLAEGGSSDWAQGGIAAAIGPGDDPESHATDTIAVSGGLADPSVAALITARAAAWIARLGDWGARFDRNEDGDIMLGREAGHSRHRIVHSFGDATGRELMRTLRVSVRSEPDIDVYERITVIDLVVDDGQVAGVVALDGEGARVLYLAPATILATGGIGQLYSKTTNPVEVTGDGIAMAARIGARLADLEFVQFHPTALASGLDPMPLLTEALRGAGAVLVDDAGERYMPALHPDAELAPRDVVARANFRQRQEGRGANLDARHLGEEFPHRFPTVFGFARAAGIDPRLEVMPVSPAVHYYMGGIHTDATGRTSVPGLWAVGECSSSGLHGANRLASNSLLEGLVMGERAAADVGSAAGVRSVAPAAPTGAWDAQPIASATADDVRVILWEHAGVERSAEGLEKALSTIGSLPVDGSIAGRNAGALGELIARSALARQESRGGHYRLDFPESDPAFAERTMLESLPAELQPMPAGVM